MKRVALWSIVLTVFCLGACGSDSTTAPTTTTTTAPATLGITPTTSVLVVGQTQAYSPTNASAAAVITWASSDSSIMTVDSNGNATGVSRGTATITVSADDGTTSTLQVQVVPNYQGNWTGRTTVIACTDIGAFVSNNYCAQRIKTSQPLLLSLTQNVLSIAGTVYVTDTGGQVAGTVTGSIAAASGDIATLIGPLTGVVNGSNLTFTPISWDSLATGGVMTGSWAANVTSPQIVGIATVQWTFSGVTRTSSSALQDARSAGLLPHVRYR